MKIAVLMLIAALCAPVLAEGGPCSSHMVDEAISRVDSLLAAAGEAQRAKISFQEYASIIRAALESSAVKIELAALANGQGAEVIPKLKQISRDSDKRLHQHALADENLRLLLEGGKAENSRAPAGGVSFDKVEFLGSFSSSWGEEYFLNKWLGEEHGSGAVMVIDSNDLKGEH
jgi:hypothetical protein